MSLTTAAPRLREDEALAEKIKNLPSDLRERFIAPGLSHEPDCTEAIKRCGKKCTKKTWTELMRSFFPNKTIESDNPEGTFKKWCSRKRLYNEPILGKPIPPEPIPISIYTHSCLYVLIRVLSPIVQNVIPTIEEELRIIRSIRQHNTSSIEGENTNVDFAAVIDDIKTLNSTFASVNYPFIRNLPYYKPLYKLNKLMQWIETMFARDVTLISLPRDYVYSLISFVGGYLVEMKWNDNRPIQHPYSPQREVILRRRNAWDNVISEINNMLDATDLGQRLPNNSNERLVNAFWWFLLRSYDTYRGDASETYWMSDRFNDELV